MTAVADRERIDYPAEIRPRRMPVGYRARATTKQTLEVGARFAMQSLSFSFFLSLSFFSLDYAARGTNGRGNTLPLSLSLCVSVFLSFASPRRPARAFHFSLFFILSTVCGHAAVSAMQRIALFRGAEIFLADSSRYSLQLGYPRCTPFYFSPFFLVVCSGESPRGSRDEGSEMPRRHAKLRCFAGKRKVKAALAVCARRMARFNSDAVATIERHGTSP